MALPPEQHRRLVQLLGMMGSDHNGEVLNAARLAQRLVRDHGLTWEEVMTGIATDIARELGQAFETGYANGRAYRPPSWRVFAQSLLDDDDGRLNSWEREFVASFIDRGWDRPTDRQQGVFERIADKCGVNTP